MRVDLKSHFKMFINRAKYGNNEKSLCLFVCFFKDNCVSWDGEEAKHFGDGPI